jgi:hypothetical protein
MNDFSTDYLIVGSGAVGLAFADTLLAEAPEATLAIVDRQGMPGGHWNHAYGFVTLHQPSAFYGVNSLPLGSGSRDAHGPNAGMYELASGAEVCSYFDAVMRRRLLPSGRVRYLPMTEHLGDGRLRSLASGAEMQVEVRRKTVDATHYAPRIPALHRPKFSVESGVQLVAPNALPGLALRDRRAPPHYAILGAGKTAMDVAVWLRGVGVPAGQITWVMPRDSWLLDRRGTQPGIESFHDSIGGQALQMQAFARARSIADLFEQLEAAQVMLRIDQEAQPAMFHYATISRGEVEVLRGIQDVVRLGHVQAVGAGGMRLAQGTRAMPPGTLYVDCTASAVEPRASVPMFQPGRIVPQLVRAPQPAFSAALVAYVEAHGADDEQKNALCHPVPFPDRPEDYPRTVLTNLRNEAAWAKDTALRAWIKASRLDGFRKVIEAVDRSDQEKVAVLAALREHASAAAENLQRLARG